MTAPQLKKELMINNFRQPTYCLCNVVRSWRVKKESMNIYLLEQYLNNGDDTYDSCVVAAINETAARNTHPSSFVTHIKDEKWMGTYTKGGEYEEDSSGWVEYLEIEQIKVTLIGVANENVSEGVICASFNAG